MDPVLHRVGREFTELAERDSHFLLRLPKGLAPLRPGGPRTHV